MQQDTTKIIRHTITRLLAKREHSQRELLAKLKQRDLPEAESLSLIEEFKKANIQSDERYAEAVVRGAQNKGKGPLFVKRTLEQQDIFYASAQQYMQEERFDWFELALSVRKKRFGNEIPIEFNDIQKQKRFLMYRGFEDEHIKYALKPDSY
ncbi:regulatory protein RecX [Glaciecola sp. KUL10]|uniref:regulatory protein RecX n=1 Tax=Glaciecola sp. (strain KUL10) TaxID=2161813 RepID=UPI000D784206|nr:regulatory protein RecX [Glaciecola sp. KUL10]GBL04015.1 regulatory protein [Glaciecola sp. KUL10]